MGELLLYPRILYVVNRHPGTIANLNSLLSKKLIPASSMLPGVVLNQTTVQQIQATIESESLEPEVYKQTYSEINALISLEDYEWVILDRPGGKLLAAPIQGYVFMQTASSPVHHYIEFSDPSLSIPYSSINSILMHHISKAANLSELPAAAANLINAHRPGSIRRTRERAPKIPKLVPDQPSSHRAVHKPHADEIRASAVKPKESSAALTKGGVVFESYYESIMPLQDYLQANVANLKEQFTDVADLAFTGNWHNNGAVVVEAFRLTDNRGHGAWFVQGKFA